MRIFKIGAAILVAVLFTACQNDSEINLTESLPIETAVVETPVEAPVEPSEDVSIPAHAVTTEDVAIAPEIVIEEPETVVVPEPVLSEADIKKQEGKDQLLSIRAKSKPSGYKRFTDEYDDWFEKYTGRYLPFHEYYVVKAQCYQESLLKADAESPVGAQGLCQFMPGTWRDTAKSLQFSATDNAFNPERSIQAAAYYDGRLRKTWKSDRPEKDRMNLVFASYNAGAGHLINAQKVCGGPNLYDDIVICLPQITGHHSVETMQYVERIRKWEYMMKMGD